MTWGREGWHTKFSATHSATDGRRRRGEWGKDGEGKKTPDGTSEGTVSRFISGHPPNGDTPEVRPHE